MTKSDRDFNQLINGLKNSDTQLQIISMCNVLRWKIIASCILAGVIISLAIITVLASKFGWLAFCVASAICLVLYADSKIHRLSELCKKQERIYFSSCLTNAESEDELAQAGLDFLPIVNNLASQVEHLELELETERAYRDD